MAAAQPPGPVWSLAAVALVPWLRTSLRARPRRAAALGCAVGTLYGCCIARWVPAALIALGAPRPGAALLWVLLAALGGGLRFALLGWVVSRLGTRGTIAHTVVSAGCVFAIESTALAWGGGMPWALLGHSQVESGVAQLAVVGGLPSVSSLLWAVNLVLARIGVGRCGEVQWAAAVASAWLALALVGTPLAAVLRPDPTAPTRSILIVQPDIPREQRWQPRLQMRHLERLVALTARGLAESGREVELVVWPENVVTRRVDRDGRYLRRLRDHVDAWRVSLLLGVVRSASGAAPGRYRSSLLWVAPTRGVIAALDKRFAVPIVESSGGSAVRSMLSPLLGDVARWDRVEEGGAAGPLRAEFTLAALLCFEALLPGAARGRRDARTLAIVNPADDSWVRGEMATRQLTAFARYRAIEQRLPLLRVAHGGLSAAFDSLGRPLGELPLDAEAWMSVSLGVSPPPGIAERLGVAALPVVMGAGVWWLWGAVVGWGRAK
jgi:apolipoprotein N-acyltransferase